MRADSTVYLTIPISGPSAALVDPAAVSVSFDATTTWHPVEAATGGVRVLVGPASDVGALPPGIHRVIVKVAADAETPILDAGAVVIE